MKILYFAHLKDKKIELPNDEILVALENMGHEVVNIDEYDFDMQNLIQEANKCDLFLFHRGGCYFHSEHDFFASLSRIITILNEIKCKKVCWYYDKVLSFSNTYLITLEEKVDYIFVNDDTWLRAFETDKIFSLHCGAETKRNGKKMKELSTDISMIGMVYGAREIFVKEMMNRFGKKFKHYDNIWGKDFDNLCISSKIIVVPRYPMDDFYWTDMIYKTLKAGGFLIFPRLEGIKEEGFEEGKHYVAYSYTKELIDAIKFFLDKKNKDIRRTIAEQGQKFVNEFTYQKRLKVIFDKLEDESKSK